MHVIFWELWRWRQLLRSIHQIQLHPISTAELSYDIYLIFIFDVVPMNQIYQSGIGSSLPCLNRDSVPCPVKLAAFIAGRKADNIFIRSLLSFSLPSKKKSALFSSGLHFPLKTGFIFTPQGFSRFFLGGRGTRHDWINLIFIIIIIVIFVLCS